MDSLEHPMFYGRYLDIEDSQSDYVAPNQGNGSVTLANNNNMMISKGVVSADDHGLKVKSKGINSEQQSSTDPTASCTLGSYDTYSVEEEDGRDEVFGTRKQRWVVKQNKNRKHQHSPSSGVHQRREVVSVISPEGEDYMLETLESEEEIFQLGGDEILEVNEEKRFCLLGKFAGRFPGMRAIIQMVRSWKVRCRADYAYNDHVIFWFNKEDDRDVVASGGPYLLLGKRLFLDYLPANFALRFEDYCFLPVWVRLPGLPLKCWHPKALSRIATKLGKPIFMDRFTKERKKVSFARILVDMNCSVCPVDNISFKLPDGTTWTQKILYEYLPPYCARCGGVKHYTLDCPLTKVENNLRNREGASISSSLSPENACEMLENCSQEMALPIEKQSLDVSDDIESKKEQCILEKEGGCPTNNISDVAEKVQQLDSSDHTFNQNTSNEMEGAYESTTSPDAYENTQLCESVDGLTGKQTTSDHYNGVNSSGLCQKKNFPAMRNYGGYP
nr:uncharacterized protein LOC109172115 [Ipomoea batatas]